ncbi:MAG: efflux RND transporter periplasmic adaptor subunit [Clostridia bacterium]|nr:efflux RND transporter periplasmic adaptor subunit [Clostridia bacterium]
MKKKIIIGSIIALVVVIFVGINISRNNSSSAAFAGGKTTAVRVKKIEKGNISSSVSSNGIIEEIEKAEVYFDTPLQVRQVLVEKNQKVTKGQKILDVNVDELVSQLEQAKINKVSQELAIKKVRALSGTKSTGSMEAAVTIAENNIKNAESAYNDSKKVYEDNKELYGSGAISKSELDRCEKAVKDAEIALKNAKLNYNTAVDNLNETRKANSQSASSTSIDIEMQEQTLKGTILNISNLEAKLKRINESVLSPIEGTISELNVIQGAYTSNMQAAYKVVNPHKVRAKARVSEFNIRNVMVGQNVEISGDAIDKEKKISGKVISISPTAVKNMTSNGEETAFEVLISTDNSENILKPGLNVTCNIFTVEKKGIVVAELNMLDTDKDDNKFVYLVSANDNVMKKTMVKTGITSDMSTEIVEGLKEGDAVVLDPQPTFKDGAKVKIMEEEKK